MDNLDYDLWDYFRIIRNNDNCDEYFHEIVCKDGYIMRFEFLKSKTNVEEQVSFAKHIVHTHRITKAIIPAEFSVFWNNYIPK